MAEHTEEKMLAEIKVFGKSAVYYIKIFARWSGKQLKALVVWAWREGDEINKILRRAYPVIKNDIKSAAQKIDEAVAKFIKDVSGTVPNISTASMLQNAI